MDICWLKIIWLHLAALRFMLCILPQTSYLTSEEFIDSSQILAGDIFEFSQLNMLKMNSSYHFRPVLYAVLTSGIPYTMLSWCSYICHSIVTPYMLILLPRIWMTVLSFVLDILIYKIALQLYKNVEMANYAVLVFASSHVTWVYCTRTLSGAIELLLITCLLYFVMLETKSQTIVPHHHGFMIACTVTTGVFINIFFLRCALFPLLYWLFCCRHANQNYYVGFVSKLLSFLFGTVFASSIFVLSDCLYYNYEAFSAFPNVVDVFKFISWLSNLSWSPLIQYASGKKIHCSDELYKCCSDGFESFLYTFGPLLPLLCTLYFWKNWRRKLHTCAKIAHKDYMFLLLSTVMVAFLLSLITLTEGLQDFVPLLAPVAILSAPFFYPVNFHKSLTSIWLCFNGFAFIYFGMIYHGGMYPCMEYIHSMVQTHSEMQAPGTLVKIEILFYHTVEPPAHLAAWEHNDDLMVNTTVINPTTYESLEKRINESLRKLDCFVYLVMPGSLPCDQQSKLQHAYHLNWHYEIFPHLHLTSHQWFDEDQCTHSYNNGKKDIHTFMQMMSLNIFRVQHVNVLQKTVSSDHDVLTINLLKGQAVSEKF